MIGGVMRHALLMMKPKAGLCLLVAALALMLVAPVAAHALEPLPIAQGEVTNASTAVGIAGATVSGYWFSAELDEYLWTGDATTAAGGAYTLSDGLGYGAGTYGFSVSATGYVSQWVTAYWSGGTPLAKDFALAPARSIAAGYVMTVVAGAPAVPIANARVSALLYDSDYGGYVPAGEALTDATGHYVVYDEVGLGAGTYRLAVEAAGYESQVKDDQAWDGSRQLAVDFTLRALPRIAAGLVSEYNSRIPIAGALVEARWLDPDTQEYQWAGEALTGADGRYTIYDATGSGAGQYEFRASAAGYVPKSSTGSWAGGTPLAVNFVLSPPVQVADGKVLDGVTQGPLEGARVTAFFRKTATEEWQQFAETTTTAEGAFAVYDTVGSGSGYYRFDAAAAGFYPGSALTEWGGGAHVHPLISLQPVPTIVRAKVIDAQTGLAIVAAHVEAYRNTPTGGAPIFLGVAISDQDGVFTFLDEMQLGAGEYEFHAFASGYRDGVRVEVWAGAAPVEFSLALTPIPPIATGIVTTAGSGVLIEGAVVTATGWDSEAQQSVVTGVAHTLADGSYAVYDEQGLGPGEYEISFEAEDHYPDHDYVAWDGTAASPLTRTANRERRRHRRRYPTGDRGGPRRGGMARPRDRRVLLGR